MKKVLALLLALIMVLGLAACATKEAPAKTDDPAPADTTNTETTEQTPADATDTAESVTIKIWFHGSNVTPEASEKVMAELNPYLNEKIGVTLDPIWGTWGDFDTSTVTALAGGDDVDIYFTCNWSADEYNKYARDGYWVKLDDMLEKDAPELLATIPEGIWECARTNGLDGMGIYAVPGLKDTATQNCWDVNGTLLAELGYDVDAVCAAGLDYYSDEYEEMLQKAKDAKGGDFYPLLIEPAVLERLVTHTSIVTGDLNGGNVLSYYYDAEHPSKDIGSTIVNKFATDEFKKFADRTYYYAQKGFISPSCQSVATANDYRTACQSTGDYLFCTQSYAFGCELDFSKARGIDVRMVPSSFLWKASPTTRTTTAPSPSSTMPVRPILRGRTASAMCVSSRRPATRAPISGSASPRTMTRQRPSPTAASSSTPLSARRKQPLWPTSGPSTPSTS